MTPTRKGLIADRGVELRWEMIPRPFVSTFFEQTYVSLTVGIRSRFSDPVFSVWVGLDLPLRVANALDYVLPAERGIYSKHAFAHWPEKAASS